MPTYEYQCDDCGKTFEAVQKITEDSLSTCNLCGGTHVKRLISAPAFHLKGSGWYKTDYAGKSSGSTAASSESSSTESSTSSESSTKPEAKKTSGGGCGHGSGGCGCG